MQNKAKAEAKAKYTSFPIKRLELRRILRFVKGVFGLLKQSSTAFTEISLRLLHSAHYGIRIAVLLMF